MLVLADKIAKAHKKKGFCGGIIYGSRGIGKSSYVLKVLRDLYMAQGYSEDEAYDMALKTMKFKLQDVLSFVRQHADNEDLAMCLVVDDAGAHLSKFLWWSQPYEVRFLQAMTDTLRSAVSSMLMTCPSPKSVLKFLRTDYDDYFIRVTAKDAEWQRMATGYRMFTLPSGKTWVSKKFEDHFSCYLPDDVFQRYDKMRRGYLKEALIELEKIATNMESYPSLEKEALGVEQ